MKLGTKIFLVIVLVLICGGIARVALNSKPSSKISKDSLDNFAQCLKDRGAKFYGAFWCSHCRAQKKMFGSSVKYLPYVECSTPNMQMNQMCKDLGIKGYPTWIFSDSSRLGGEVELDVLAKKTSCVLVK